MNGAIYSFRRTFMLKILVKENFQKGPTFVGGSLWLSEIVA